MSSTRKTVTDPPDDARRRFLQKLSISLGAFAALLVGVPIVGFVLEPLLRRSAVAWRPVGKRDDFQVGQTVEVTFEDASPMAWAGVTAKTGAWLRRNGEDEFVAFALNCTHLGCPVRWVANAELFMCPCHGGVYYSDGRVAGGPPPRPLTRYPVRVRGENVEIQTSSIPIT
jgi:menaquinol-cytochrome c reductase iron-sulfur subunit